MPAVNSMTTLSTVCIYASSLSGSNSCAGYKFIKKETNN